MACFTERQFFWPPIGAWTPAIIDTWQSALCKEAHLVTISEFEVPRDAVIVEIEEKYKPAITMDHLEEALMSTGPSDHLKHIEKFQIKFGSNAN